MVYLLKVNTLPQAPYHLHIVYQDGENSTIYTPLCRGHLSIEDTFSKKQWCPICAVCPEQELIAVQILIEGSKPLFFVNAYNSLCKKAKDVNSGPFNSRMFHCEVFALSQFRTGQKSTFFTSMSKRWRVQAPKYNLKENSMPSHRL